MSPQYCVILDTLTSYYFAESQEDAEEILRLYPQTHQLAAGRLSSLRQATRVAENLQRVERNREEIFQ